MANAEPRAVGLLRDAIVAAGWRLGSRGLIAAGEGNLSVRLADGGLLITPAGLRKDALDAADLVRLRPDGTPVGRSRSLPPSSDLRLHLAVYRARPDVAAYVHAHVPAAMALTLAGRPPDPSALPETAAVLPRLPVVPLALPGSEALAAALAAALTTPPEPLPAAVLLECHGAVAVGLGRAGPAAAQALTAAVDRIELIDVLCRVWRDTILLGAPLTAESG